MKKKCILSQADRQVFIDAMSDVNPIKQKNVVEPFKKIKKTPSKSPFEEEEPVKYRLSDAQEHQFVQGDKIIRYASNGISPRTAKKLHGGKLPVEGRLDLHGSRIEQARQQVSQFIHDSQLFNKKCVIIVHGKGAEGKTPVLKSMINHWLRQIPAVLAFSSAQKKDGGSGALYVLIKSNPHGGGEFSASFPIDK